MMTLSEAARALNATLLGNDVTFQAVSTDTRTLQPGDLYVALTGDNFDGHAFVADAIAKGASAILISAALEAAAVPALRVVDTRLALGQLSAAWRARFSIPVIAVTGSNGKTTTKEMLAAIFGQRGSVLATQGNLNNEIGVPLTLLRLRAEHRYAVIEMGASHPGEIAYLSSLARPTVALITNAAVAHLGGFGSLDEVARTKGGIYEGLADTGVGVVNADDAYASLWRGIVSERRCVTFGMRTATDVHTDRDEIKCQMDSQAVTTVFEMHAPVGDVTIALPLLGTHNVMNALAASAAALAAGATLDDIHNGLQGMHAVKGRLTVKQGIHGVRVIDDTYNANPPSVRAAIDVLAAATGQKILVLGDMGELGDDAPAFHAQVGVQAQAAGINQLYAIGDLSLLAVQSFGNGGHHYASHEGMCAALASALPGLGSSTTVLVKGSRFMRMERVVEAIVNTGKD
jgi:UDP-N-acetylmuramoyl-tripeptide--D-alanyl-D-alanine ligase